MKSLCCRDLGGECDFIVYGETEEEVKSHMIRHTQRDHADKLEEMSESEVQMVLERMDDLLQRKKAA